MIILINDTRCAIKLNIYDSFVDGVSTDYKAFELGARSDLEIRASNVWEIYSLIVVGVAWQIFNCKFAASHRR